MGNASQSRKQKQKQKDSRLWLEVLQILCFLLDSDGGVVSMIPTDILLFVPDKELRPSLFIHFK